MEDQTQTHLNPIDMQLEELKARVEEALKQIKAKPHADYGYHLYDILNIVNKAQASISTQEVPRKTYTVKSDRDTVSERHESYGCARINRYSGGGRLFGSFLPICREGLRFEICEAEKQFDLNDSRVYGSKVLLSFDMSMLQWAELLVSGYTGIQVPVTLRRILGVRLDDVPEEAITETEAIHQQFKKEGMKPVSEIEGEFIAKMKDLTEAIQTSGLPKKKQAELLALASQVRSLVSAPVAAALWASTRLAETTDKMVSAARQELLGTVETLSRRTGLDLSTSLFKGLGGKHEG